MKKHIVLVGTLVAVFSSGNSFGATSLARCCSGNFCTVAFSDNCQTCTTNADCGGGSGTIETTCPDECPSTEWTLVGFDGIVNYADPQYQTKCVLKSCQYRCASGSYGNPTSSTSGCSRCPSVNKGETTSGGGVSLAKYGVSEAGSKYITDCYAAKDVSYTDSTGTFKFTDDCYYTE